MPLALIEGSTVSCPHAGGVSLVGRAWLLVSGSAVITTTSITSNPVDSPICTLSTAPCTMVASSGGSATLKQNSESCVLQNSSIVIANPVIGPQIGSVVAVGQSTLNG